MTHHVDLATIHLDSGATANQGPTHGCVMEWTARFAGVPELEDDRRPDGGAGVSKLIAEFTVVGTPVPQGSTRAFAGKGKAAGRAFITNDPTGSISKWRADIRSEALAIRRVVQTALPDGPISMRLAFRLPRPKSHYLGVTTKRPRPELRPDAPTWAPGGKDLDKLVRAVLDALTGVCYVDDVQVVVIGATKSFADPELAPAQPGVDIRVSALDV